MAELKISPQGFMLSDTIVMLDIFCQVHSTFDMVLDPWEMISEELILLLPGMREEDRATPSLCPSQQ